MYRDLGAMTLKSGAPLRCGVVIGPDPEWHDRLVPFLGHKRPETREQIRRSLAESLDDLETRYYVGCVEDRLITQVMIAVSRRVGILGHVYTLPECRRQGACVALFERMMDDVRARGDRVLVLSTGYDTPPYWIYHRFGFRSIAPGRGQMKWLASPDAETDLFAPATTTPRRLHWGDWPWVDRLGMQLPTPDEDRPRSALWRLRDFGSLETPFSVFQAHRTEATHATAFVAAGGSTVGWAILAPDPTWFGDALLLDFYLHPHFVAQAESLLTELLRPAERPVVAITGEPAGWKRRLLGALGFRAQARIATWQLWQRA